MRAAPVAGVGFDALEITVEPPRYSRHLSWLGRSSDGQTGDIVVTFAEVTEFSAGDVRISQAVFQ
jgi:hypothetical protein